MPMIKCSTKSRNWRIKVQRRVDYEERREEKARTEEIKIVKN